MINWIPKSKGDGRWYESECKRFAIHKGDNSGNRSKWILIDRAGKDTIGRSWIYYCDCLPSARKHAELRAKGES